LRSKTLAEGEFTSPKHFNSRSGIPKQKRPALQAASVLEQGTGIEPAFSAWEALLRLFPRRRKTLENPLFSMVFRLFRFLGFYEFSQIFASFQKDRVTIE